MSQQGVATKSQSTIGFLTTSATGTNEVSQQQKRQRTEVTETPNIVVSNINDQPFASSSATTIVDNGANLTEAEDIEFIRLERLHDKRDRYASHVSFLKDCYLA